MTPSVTLARCCRLLAIAMVAWFALCPVGQADQPTRSLATAIGGYAPKPAATEIAQRLFMAPFPEPLVAAGPTTKAEDSALWGAVVAFGARVDPDDFSALDAFLAGHPTSPWRVAVLTNLGITYLHSGYYAKALAAWEAAWREGKQITEPRGRRLVDRAVAEAALLQAGLGHTEGLAALLDEIGDRIMTGSTGEMVTEARELLALMRKDPKHLYLCGPMALRALMLAEKVSLDRADFLYTARATPGKGVSLAELATLAERDQTSPYRVVFRTPGEPVPVPSVMHWKVGHYAAIVAENNGRYLIKDMIFGRRDAWITEAALDSEASGYFLTPAAAQQAAGWRPVDQDEAGKVWGMGQGLPTGQNSDCHPPQCCGPGSGMTTYHICEEEISLNLTDTPVGYTPPKGPAPLVTINYNQRDMAQPANLNFFNVSPQWTFNWLSFIEDDATAPGSNVTRYDAGGGLSAYSGYNGGTGAFAPEEDDAAVLVLSSTSPVEYRRNLADGSVEVYAQSNGGTSSRFVFLTQVIDPQGNKLTLGYDAQSRLTSLTDAVGRVTTFAYGNASFPLQITQITDPFGRSATLAYDASGRLSSITDVIGITSSYTYDASSVVASLTTPYGTTHFAWGGDANSFSRFLQITDPLGNSEREEMQQPAAVPDSDPPSTVPTGMVALLNQYHIWRNSFYWDAHAYKIAGCTPTGGCDYSDARLTHFDHDANNLGFEWYTVESVKYPLENRIWYNYPGQPTTGLGAGVSGTFDYPSGIGRVLDDGTTQLTKYAYNSAGRITQMTDPADRQTNLTYAANLVDLTAVSRKTANGNATLQRFTYNTHHRPLTEIDAANQTTTYTYNAAGQVTSRKNPLGQLTKYTYNSNGDLQSVVNANGVTQEKYTYDSFDRRASYTDSEGLKVTYAYDAADRPTRITYPDGTTDRFTYNKLDLASYTNRQGHVWHLAYDADRRLTSVTDPLGHKTDYAYFENGTQKSETDPNGNVTSSEIDVQSRQTAKVFPDGSRTTYRYEKTIDRIATITDALGQIKNFTYTVDDRLARINYTNAIQPTPSVSYAYDRYFPRLASMTDGTGTAQFQYVPVGQLGALSLASDTSAVPNSAITYGYDALTRVTSRTIAGAADHESFRYDAIGRLTAHSDPLGNFSLSYLGQTAQLTGRNAAGTGVSTTLSYLTNTDDRRLAGINHTAGRGFAYTTTPQDLLTQSVETVNAWRSGASKPGQTWTYSYDNNDRLLTGASTKEGAFAYSYDANDNTKTITAPSGNATGTYNKLNAVTTFGGRTYSYDANGNLLSDGQRQYQWDAENRLVGIDYIGKAGMHTAFAYDGLSRRVSISETPAGGGNTVTTRYLWCGAAICQSRDSANNMLRDYLSEGETVAHSASRLYYGRDRIGSVRDALLVNADFDSVQAYDYDPYGNATATPTTGDVADFRFAGMFFHAPSGLYLTQFRVYDPRAGRWLSRDPSGESTTNLYAYVGAGPVNAFDPLGLVSVYSQEQCERLLDKIKNIADRIAKRERELKDDPLDLPGTCPGDKQKPSLSRAGHQMLINMDKALLAARGAEYVAFCSDYPPPPTLETDPKFWQNVAKYAPWIIAGYFIISEGSRIIPIRNAVPVL